MARRDGLRAPHALPVQPEQRREPLHGTHTDRDCTSHVHSRIENFINLGMLGSHTISHLLQCQRPSQPTPLSPTRCSPTRSPPGHWLFRSRRTSSSSVRRASIAIKMYGCIHYSGSTVGAGLYSFFSAYDQACLKDNSCQDQLVSIDNDSTVWMYSLSTVGVTNQLSLGDQPVIPASQNPNGFQVGCITHRKSNLT